MGREFGSPEDFGGGNEGESVAEITEKPEVLAEEKSEAEDIKQLLVGKLKVASDRWGDLTDEVAEIKDEQIRKDLSKFIDEKCVELKLTERFDAGEQSKELLGDYENLITTLQKRLDEVNGKEMAVKSVERLVKKEIDESDIVLGLESIKNTRKSLIEYLETLSEEAGVVKYDHNGSKGSITPKGLLERVKNFFNGDLDLPNIDIDKMHIDVDIYPVRDKIRKILREEKAKVEKPAKKKEKKPEQIQKEQQKKEKELNEKLEIFKETARELWVDLISGYENDGLSDAPAMKVVEDWLRKQMQTNLGYYMGEKAEEKIAEIIKEIK